MEAPFFFPENITFFLINAELMLYNKDRPINPAFGCGFGMGFSKYGIGPYAVPLDFNLIHGHSKIRFETGIGIMPVGGDVMMRLRFGFRAILNYNIFMRLSYTPYLMLPDGEKVEGEHYIDIKSDISFSMGYRFNRSKKKEE